MVDGGLRADCALLGIDVNQVIPTEHQRTRPQDHVLWPEHEKAWAVFLGCQSQWNLVVGMAGALYLGLNYPAMEVVRRAHRIADEEWGEVLEQVQVLEFEGLRIRNA